MNRRHLRSAPVQPPTQPLTTPVDLPNHLVATPMARGLSRLGVGTLPFNIVAMVTLVGMSAVVVMGPTRLPGTSAPDELASRATTTAPASGGAGSARRSGVADRDEAPTTVAPPSTPTSAAGGGAATESSTTTAKPRSTTTSRPRTDARLVSTPLSARVVTCDDFTLQPEAQSSFDADPTGRVGLDGDADGIACEHLTGRPLGITAITNRRIPTTDELLNPPTRLFGVHTPNAPYADSEIDDFAAAAGKTPNTVLFFQNFSQQFPAAALGKAWGRGMLPMISFEPIVQNSIEGQPALADITDGEWDGYFTTWATAAKADGRPIAFRFAQEMNGNWYPWSDGRFGNAPGDFVRAWRHIHDLFESLEVENVIWVWSVNRIDNLPDRTLERVYPGDRYVDWVGLSGYLRSIDDDDTPSFDFTFGATLAAVEDVAPTKHVMLTEVGAGTSESNRVTWLSSFFAGLLEHPEIIGFNWFNDFKDGGDWRIQYSTATSAAFASGVADARYGVVAPPTP